MTERNMIGILSAALQPANIAGESWMHNSKGLSQLLQTVTFVIKKKCRKMCYQKNVEKC